MEVETVQKDECSWTGSPVFDVSHGHFYHLQFTLQSRNHITIVMVAGRLHLISL